MVEQYPHVSAPMSYQLHVTRGLFVVRWGDPQPGDPAKYLAALTDAASKQGDKLVGLFIMPEDSPPPGEAFRREQAALLDRVMERLHFAIAVFEGRGFAPSLKRSALVAILMLSSKRQKVFVRSSVEEALVSNPPAGLSFDGAMLLSTLRGLGFCDVPHRQTA